jgi:hypothetical protein
LRIDFASLHGRDVVITKGAKLQPRRCFLSQDSKELIGAHLKQSLAALERAAGDAALLATARKIAAAIAALRCGNRILRTASATRSGRVWKCEGSKR